MGTTTGIICLVIGIISLIASLFNPGSLILAAIALYAAYANLKGVNPLAAPRLATENETFTCANCGTKNLAIAKVCRTCAKRLVQAEDQSTAVQS